MQNSDSQLGGRDLHGGHQAFSEGSREVSADVMTYLFALRLILGGKLDLCARDDFFCSSLDFGRKVGHLRCICLCLLIRNFGRGWFGYAGLQSVSLNIKGREPLMEKVYSSSYVFLLISVFLHMQSGME